MTSEVALKVGMAAGTAFRSGSHRHRVVIGKDTRLSGYMLEAALMSGFTSVGMDVFLLGPMPTPAVSMLTRSLRADLGVMLSASHNPSHDNGIKLFDPDGYKLSDEMERQIEDLIDADSKTLLVEADRIGRATRVESAPCPSTCGSPGSASSSIAPMARPTRWRLKRFGSLAPR
jgi:phosphoglucosamine mutase